MSVNVSTIGSDPTRDYSAVSGWEAGQRGNFVTGTVIERGDMYNDSQLDDAVGFSASTTSALYYWLLRTPADERHDGTKDSGARIEYDGAFGETIDVQDDYWRIEGVEIHSGSSEHSSHEAIKVQSVGSNTDIRIEKCLICGENDSSSRGIEINDSTATVKISNNFIYDIDTSNGVGILVTDAATVYAYHNSILDMKYGIQRVAGTVIAKNNAVFDCATANFTGTFHADSDYNCCSDTSAPGSNSKNSKTASDNFTSVTAGSQNLHVKDNTADIYFAGKDLATDTYPILDDIDDNTRTTYDIGADEYSPGAASQALILAKKYYSIHKVGLTYVRADCELVDMMSDLGDVCTIQTGNPAISFTKALIFKVERTFGGKNRIRVHCLTGGWLWDEDGAWS